MKDQDMRKSAADLAADLAASISRDIEILLNFMNENEQHFVVSKDNRVITEYEFREHIAKYMRLCESFASPKPTEEKPSEKE